MDWGGGGGELDQSHLATKMSFDEKGVGQILLDSSACPEYLWQTPSDTAPNDQESECWLRGVCNELYLGDKHSVLE